MSGLARPFAGSADSAYATRSGQHLELAGRAQRLGVARPQNSPLDSERLLQQLAGDEVVAAAHVQAAEVVQRDGHLGASATLRMELAEVLAWDRADEAGELAQSVLRQPVPPNLVIRARRVLSRVSVLRGEWAQAVEQVTALAAEPLLDQVSRARLMADSVAHRAWLGGEMVAAAAFGEQALALAEDVGDDAALVSACAGLGAVLLGMGQLDRALALTSRAVRVSTQSTDDAARRLHPHVPHAFVLQERDDLEAMGTVVASGLALGRRLGGWQAPLYHLESGFRLFNLGQWDDAVAELETGLEMADDVGTRLADPIGHACLGLIARHRGADEAAARHVATGFEKLMLHGGGFGVDWLTACHAEILADSDVEQALAVLRRTWDAAEGTGAVLHRRVLGPLLVTSSLAVGDEAQARAVARRLADAGALTGVAAVVLLGDLCMAMVERDVDSLRGCVERLETTTRLPERASALSLVGRALLPHDADAGGAALTAAADLYASLGATASSARAEGLLQAVGGKRRANRGLDRPGTGWGSLTPAESAVVELAAQALTTAEIARRLHLSPHTVETHLKHVYRKLAVRSRVALALEYQRQGYRREP